MTAAASLNITPRLAAETERHMALLEKLGQKLHATMDVEVCTDNNGSKTSDTPNRDWCRSYGRYQTGMASLLVEERERSKLRLLAERNGGQRALTDEEYDAEMRVLAIEALRAMPPGELEAEVERRGLVVQVPDEREDDDA